MKNNTTNPTKQQKQQWVKQAVKMGLGNIFGVKRSGNK
jgi:hypothetical protein